jgi:hypothetical protein
MKIISIISKMLASLVASLRRFPISIGLAAAATLILIYQVHNADSLGKNTVELLGRIAMVIALGVPISLCLKLLCERGYISKLVHKAAAYIFSASALVLYYFLLLKKFDMVSISRYTAFTLALYLAFMFVPYFLKREGFQLYIIKLFTRFFVTVIYSVVLFLGIAAILFTIDKLLGVNINEKVYLDIWLAVLGIFAPCYFLAGVPEENQSFDVIEYPKLLKVLLLYIVMPLLAVYTAILYIYFAKIVITLQWPEGMVAHLVLWYSAITAIVFFFISPFTEILKWPKFFIFWLSKVILPLILMLFVSVGIRVNQYGITEKRYFVIVLALWAFGIMIYLSLSKKHRYIILPVSLAVIAILTVAGPWSSYSISKLSQNMRFENLLIKNNMLQSGKIVKASKEISKDDQKEITGILRYFERYHKLSDARYVSEDFMLNKAKDVFGFEAPEFYDYRPSKGFSFNSDMTSIAVDIQGYDYLYHVFSYNTKNATQDNKPKDKPEVNFDPQKNEVTLMYKGDVIYKKSLLAFVETLAAKYSDEYKPIKVGDPEFLLIDENDKVKVKYMFENIYGMRSSDSTDFKVDSMQFYLLVDVK